MPLAFTGFGTFLRNVGNNLQDVTTQKITIDIFTGLRISNLRPKTLDVF